MQVAKIEGMPEAAKKRIAQQTLALSPEEQQIVVSFLPNEVLEAEIAFRNMEQEKKDKVLRKLSKGVNDEYIFG